VSQQPVYPITFGTDGWRAVIADGFTFRNLERVAQAFAHYINQSRGQVDSAPRVVVGYDRRFLSEEFALRSAEVLSANNIGVSLFSEAVPTPLVSWAVRESGAAGGVVITASHNPAAFNGFKIKAAWGGSASPEITTEVEGLLDKTEPVRRRYDLVSRDEELEALTQGYIRQIEGYVDLDRIRKSSITALVDSMHGSGGHWVESFLVGASARITTIRGDRDPLFGGVNPEPIDRNLGALRTAVLAAQAIVGLATDGDADRVGAVNELGQTMTMHEVVPLLLLHLARIRKLSGGVVRTFSQSVLTRRIASAHGLHVYETPIGFKYIADLMLKSDILIGAEESGGIGLKGHLPERDGILNSLLFLEAVVTAGTTPSEMVRRMHEEFGEFYFDRRDLHCAVESGKAFVRNLANDPPAKVGQYQVREVETLDGTKLQFDDESWLLFRQSGTEPVLRVYSEATSKAKVQQLLDEGEKLALNLAQSNA
jgi:phosphomannomutase